MKNELIWHQLCLSCGNCNISTVLFSRLLRISISLNDPQVSHLCLMVPTPLLLCMNLSSPCLSFPSCPVLFDHYCLIIDLDIFT